MGSIFFHSFTLNDPLTAFLAILRNFVTNYALSQHTRATISWKNLHYFEKLCNTILPKVRNPGTSVMLVDILSPGLVNFSRSSLLRYR